ncbi:MAG TPA: hypothetical protein VIP11_16650 [Gemmatimonadaceae bacterium]
MRTLVGLALVVGLAACGSDAADLVSAPPGIAAGTLRVTVAKSTYTRDELSGGISGSITNTSDQVFFARLGDAFNSAREQDPVYIAMGSDGALERADGSSWRVAETGILVEGVKEVELRPGKTYTFAATLPQNTSAGTYRFNIAYRTTAGAQQPSGRGISASFEIR